MSTLKGGRAVVTGGTKGTGAAIVARLRSAGANVTAVGRQRHAGGDLGADDFVAADLISAAALAAVTAHVRDSGGAQILVHVAGGSGAPSGGFAAALHQFGALCGATSTAFGGYFATKEESTISSWSGRPVFNIVSKKTIEVTGVLPRI